MTTKIKGKWFCSFQKCLGYTYCLLVVLTRTEVTKAGQSYFLFILLLSVLIHTFKKPDHKVKKMIFISNMDCWVGSDCTGVCYDIEIMCMGQQF